MKKLWGLVFLVSSSMSALASPCSTRIEAAARGKLAAEIGVPVSKISVSKINITWTQTPSNNHGAGDVTVVFEGREVNYHVFVQQIGTSQDCNVLNVH